MRNGEEFGLKTEKVMAQQYNMYLTYIKGLCCMKSVRE